MNLGLAITALLAAALFAATGHASGTGPRTAQQPSHRVLGASSPTGLPAAAATSPSTFDDAASNCTEPTQVENQFNISGLSGWDLLSHEDYHSSNASRYGHKINCTWIIKRPADSDSLVIIRIARLYLEKGPVCRYDSLRLQYVNYNSSALMNTSYCGRDFNRILLAKSDVNIQFKTDGSVSYPGFHLQWAFVSSTLATRIQAEFAPATSHVSQQSCSNTEDLHHVTLASFTAPGGQLESHEEYEFTSGSSLRANLNCQWTISSPTGHILLWIEDLALTTYVFHAAQPACIKHSLTLNFSSAVTGRHQSVILCRISTDTVFLANSSIVMKLRRDPPITYNARFDIKWMYLNDSQLDTATRVWNYFANSTDAECPSPQPLTNLTLPGAGQYPGGRLVSHTEFLTNLNSTYHPNMNCHWTISPPDNSTLIHVNIPTLELESDSRMPSVCRFDNLTLTYKSTINNRWEEKVICHSLQAITVTSSDSITVRFRTDRSVLKRGFELLWYFVPRHDAVRLPAMDNLQGINCPDVNAKEGFLSVLHYEPNSLCVWRWTVNENQMMTFDVRILSLDYRDSSRSGMRMHYYPYSSCATARDRLTFRYADSDGDVVEKNICGYSLYGRRYGRNENIITAYTGPVELSFISDGEVQGRGFHIGYSRQVLEVASYNCSQVEALNSHQSRIALNVSSGAGSNCSWRVEPKSENHIVKLTISKLVSAHAARPSMPWPREYRYRHRQIHFSPSRRYGSGSTCPLTVTIKAERVIPEAFLMRFVSQVYSNNSEDIRPHARPYRISFCSNIARFQSGMMHPILSFGAIQIQLVAALRASFSYEILIEQLPMVYPGSTDLCPRPTTLGIKHSVVSQPSLRVRLVSVKQMMVASLGDCRTSVQFGPLSQFSSREEGDQLMATVNCSHSSANLTLVTDGTVSSVACNSTAMISWNQQHQPVILVAEGTGVGGFTAELQQIKQVSDGSYRCPQYVPTKQGKWVANLPIVSATMGFALLRTFYCDIEMSADAGQDLMVQLQLPKNSEQVEQFCQYWTRRHSVRPHLRFVRSAANGKVDTLSLCDEDVPGGLLAQDKIRVASGGSLKVELIAANTLRRWSFSRIRGRQNVMADADVALLDALLVVHQVDSCPSSNDFWQLSPDRSQIHKSITIERGNTQTDCRLQVDAASAVRIANEKRILMPKAAGNAGCWNLRVMLLKFGTTCGLNQLVLTVSSWDSLAASIVHKQREVCGTGGSFTFEMKLEMKPDNDTGVSLHYTEVRSGFVAQVSLSACHTPMQTAPGVGASGASDRTSSTLTVLILILVLVDVSLLLFAFRVPILGRVRAFINGGHIDRRLSYSTGGDRVALVGDS